MSTRVAPLTGGGARIAAGIAPALPNHGHHVAALDRVEDADPTSGRALHVGGGPRG
ncbi:hypothetical protein [Actinoalloteichus sp. AHMU CJ021]|uniref:hypothetical protein n=1 Tax=Actinoalloteichus sp. AHMU CJ021 TaxID=2072503 RepID=UPI00307C6344